MVKVKMTSVLVKKVKQKAHCNLLIRADAKCCATLFFFHCSSIAEKLWGKYWGKSVGERERGDYYF